MDLPAVPSGILVFSLLFTKSPLTNSARVWLNAGAVHSSPAVGYQMSVLILPLLPGEMSQRKSTMSLQTAQLLFISPATEKSVSHRNQTNVVTRCLPTSVSFLATNRSETIFWLHTLCKLFTAFSPPTVQTCAALYLQLHAILSAHSHGGGDRRFLRGRGLWL